MASTSNPHSSKKLKILVAPLDWGLGHATRCIPIINEFLKRGCEVQIASSSDALAVLKEEFRDLNFHSITSYRVEYSSWWPFMVKILLQLPKFLSAIKKEHQEIEQIIKREKIDLVISDNRYGCWSKSARSVFITHQVNIIMVKPWKWLEGLINYGNYRQIGKFTECWVPDSPNGITGEMARAQRVKTKFIGMLSRFERKRAEIKYDVLALISGPEPQRSLFEGRLRDQFLVSGIRYFIARGKPQDKDADHSSEVNHLSASQLNDLIEASAIVICRSGYTTIMDLWKLGKKAIFIPTPGQTEQEYLAAQLTARRIAFSQNQNEFDLVRALNESKKYKGFDSYPHSPNLLAVAVDELLTK